MFQKEELFGSESPELSRLKIKRGRPRKHPLPEAINRVRRGNYEKPTVQQRQKLLKMIDSGSWDVKSACKKLDIRYTTGRNIVSCYR